MDLFPRLQRGARRPVVRAIYLSYDGDMGRELDTFMEANIVQAKDAWSAAGALTVYHMNAFHYMIHTSPSCLICSGIGRRAFDARKEMKGGHESSSSIAQRLFFE